MRRISQILLLTAATGALVLGKTADNTSQCTTTTDIDGRKLRSGVISNARDKSDFYFNNERCGWRIIIPYGSQLTFQFLTLDIDGDGPCRNDYVEIYEGSDVGGSKLIARQCESEESLSRLFKTSNTVKTGFVFFRTDGNGQKKGFELKWTRIDRDPDEPSSVKIVEKEDPSLSLRSSKVVQEEDKLFAGDVVVTGIRMKEATPRPSNKTVANSRQSVERSFFNLFNYPVLESVTLNRVLFLGSIMVVVIAILCLIGAGSVIAVSVYFIFVKKFRDMHIDYETPQANTVQSSSATLVTTISDDNKESEEIEEVKATDLTLSKPPNYATVLLDDFRDKQKEYL